MVPNTWDPASIWLWRFAYDDLAMTQRVYQFVKRHQMLEPGDRVAAAVSGGADSVALLEALVGLRDRLAVELAVAHFNHRLRGAESDADARFVEELAARHGLSFFGGAADVAAEARSRRRNLESVGRELRYQFLRSLVEGDQVTKVATGHTADDQAETVLARLLRGCGTRGLAGTYPIVDGWLLRPLLEHRRSALRAWLVERGIAWREDSSNRDLRLTRNRLRAEVVPLLETYNPRLVEHLAATAEIAQDEEADWNQRAGELLSQLATVREEQGTPILKLSLARFVQLNRAQQRRLLWAALASTGPLRRLELTHIESLRRLAVAGQSGQRLQLPARQVVRVFDCLEFRPVAGPAPAPYEYQVRVPGACVIPVTGKRLLFDLASRDPTEQGYNGIGGYLVDLELVQNPLTVRNWRPGDRLESPSGQGRKKIKTLLLERRIPAEQRKLWPVVLSGSQIVWVRGFPVARPFRMGPARQVGILIREEDWTDVEAGSPSE